MDGNAFLTSLQQLGQYLNQQNQGTGSGGIGLSSGYPEGAPAGMNLGGGPSNGGSSPGNISKVVTQVHYANPTDTGGTNQANATPAVAAAPPAPQTSNFATPQTSGNVAIAQPGGGGGGDGGGGAPSIGANQAMRAGLGGGGGAGGQGPGTGYPTSNAISGISSALSKGLTNAASAIGGVKTMPTPINMPGVPGINQVAPTLIGRRTQQNPYGY